MTDIDDDAFDAFYERARDRLAMQIAALTGDHVEAADHVQEAFIRAWARWRYVGGLDDPEAWVRRVAYNLAVSRFRRARRTVLRSQIHDVRVEWDDDQLEVVTALRTLPRAQREAIVWHHLVGLPVAEVAREMQVPVGTVKSWLSRGRHALAITLADNDADHDNTPTPAILMHSTRHRAPTASRSTPSTEETAHE